ncbi:hypothetical protein M514_25619 [Trichuris suis]|uniref:Uncharacterized protein n=1 Tax=Trichuris suis TaxID=68888 RepID=A0A085MYD3_9BILA|nr:hypothetical protein M514_25619 [Trichuris suis]
MNILMFIVQCATSWETRGEMLTRRQTCSGWYIWLITWASKIPRRGIAAGA